MNRFGNDFIAFEINLSGEGFGVAPKMIVKRRAFDISCMVAR